MPVPRNEFGHPSFAGTPDRVGNWQGLLGTLASRGPEPSAFNIPEALSYDEVPFQPWAAELHAERRAKGGAYDPHTRCKPSGGARMFHTPYGMEILDLGEEVIFINVGAPHSWRRIWVDGRNFPEEIEPGWYGYSIGHWEDDTLVVETARIQASTLLNNGMNHSDDIILTERFRLSDDGQVLVITQVYEDPAMFKGTAARVIPLDKYADHVYPYDCDPSYGAAIQNREQ